MVCVQGDMGKLEGKDADTYCTCLQINTVVDSASRGTFVT